MVRSVSWVLWQPRGGLAGRRTEGPRSLLEVLSERHCGQGQGGGGGAPMGPR